MNDRLLVYISLFKFKVSAQSLIRDVLEFVIRNCVVTDVSFPGVHCEEHFVFEVVSFEYVSPPF